MLNDIAALGTAVALLQGVTHARDAAPPQPLLFDKLLLSELIATVSDKNKNYGTSLTV